MKKNTEDQGRKPFLETIKWVITITLLSIAIVGNYLYRDVVTLPLRVIGVVFLISAACGMGLLTEKGKGIITLACEARNEIRRIIWPTRQETLYTTMIVMAFTAIMSLVLWELDSILVRLVSFITALRF